MLVGASNLSNFFPIYTRMRGEYYSIEERMVPKKLDILDALNTTPLPGVGGGAA